jgi:hypothetical protein
MDILERLSRIERLEQDEAPADVLLNEVRVLLAEAEEWVRSDGAANERAQAAVQGLREALDTGAEPVLAAERTLVA